VRGREENLSQAEPNEEGAVEESHKQLREREEKEKGVHTNTKETRCGDAKKENDVHR
jgi:hypothetical protein